MLDLFRSKPLLDEGSTQWLFDAYAWALENFGSNLFYDNTALVTPTDRHFPCKVNGVDAIAEATFQKVKGYTNMADWPIELAPFSPEEVRPPVAMIFGDTPRGSDATVEITGESDRITLNYTPEQVRQPEPLIAMFAYELAGYLSRATESPSPGGEDLRGHAADLLAIFMGFGIFFANNALRVGGGGCSSGCGGKGIETLGSLAEDEMLFALAIFCELKEIPEKEALPHLKSSLRSHFKKAVKEVRSHSEELERLKAIDRPF